MKLSVKLSLMAGFLMLLTVALGLFSLVQMAKMNAGTESINNDWLPSTRYALSISVNTSDYRAVQVQLASSTTADDHTRFKGRMDTVLKEFESNKSKYAPLVSSPEEKKTYEFFLREWQGYMEASKNVAQLAADGQNDEARNLLRGNTRALFDKSSDLLEELVRINAEGSQQAGKDCKAVYASAKLLVSCMLAAALLAGITIAAIILRGTHKQLGKDPGELNTIALRVVDGDYNIDEAAPRRVCTNPLLPWCRHSRCI